MCNDFQCIFRHVFVLLSSLLQMHVFFQPCMQFMTFLHFWSSHHTTNSFYSLICSCHSPTPFWIPLGSKFLTDPSTFKRLHNLECSTTPSSLSFFSIWFSSLAIFSIPQAAKNSPFSSFLSVLSLSSLYCDWPLGTLIWPVCRFIIHSISFILDPFIC